MQINLGFDKVKKVLHIADVHVRNYQRHKEYKKVFKELYKAVDGLPKESLVYIAGDIAITSSQQWQLTSRTWSMVRRGHVLLAMEKER